MDEKLCPFRPGEYPCNSRCSLFIKIKENDQIVGGQCSITFGATALFDLLRLAETVSRGAARPSSDRN